jgi:hypothetical protein
MTACWRIGALALVVGLALEPGGARAEPNWADPVAESAAAMRAGQYLADLRSCAWGRQPAFMVYGALSADTIEDGLVRLLPPEVAKDGGVQRNARQGFILGSRVKRRLEAEACADVAEQVRSDLGVDPRQTP